MSRFAILFMLMTFMLSAQAATSVMPFDSGLAACQVLADDAKKDNKKGEGEEAEEEEPDCD